MATTYGGQLKSSEIFAAIYNQIISQEVFADHFGKHQTIIDMARVDGGLYGDTKLFYSTDVLASRPWTNWGTGTTADDNILVPARPSAPFCQAIELNAFRVIKLTLDQYLSKRAWSNEGAFGQFNAVMLGLMGETKKCFEGTMYNVYLGNTITNVGKQLQTVNLTGTNDGQTIAKKIADILVDMGDYSRDYNDLGYFRSYADADIQIIWNADYVNKIVKVDTPTIFHKDGLVDKLDKYALPAKYFGRAVAAADKGEGKVIGTGGIVDPTKGTVRTKVEKEFTFEGEYTHMFPGEALKAGMQVGGTGHPDFAEDEVYIEDADVICKIITKFPPVMDAFLVATNFFNPSNLTDTHWLHWGYNTLQYFVDKPFVTLKKAA